MDGLEAWRLIRANLCRKHGQRLQGEFDTLTNLVPIKIAGFRDFPTLHQRWESELTRFAAVDSEYQLGKFQKRNIIYRALPQEIGEDVDREQAHNQQLSHYDDLISFVINLSRSQKYQKTSAPKPLTANLVGEQPTSNEYAPVETPAPVEPDYSVDDWIMFIKTDEGQRHLAAGNPLPQEGILALNSVVKGGWNSKGSSKGKGGKEPRQGGKAGSKGKGKDAKGKGKGKGLDHIQCHGCGKWGHYVRDCPDRSIKAVEAGEWGQAYNPNYVTLMVTDTCFNGYGKTNWCDLSNINNHDDDMAHVVEVPKPEANWERVSRTSNATAKRTKQRFMPSCTEECACETSNRWSNLNDEQHEASSIEFPTAKEAASIPSEHTRTSMPKIPRSSKQRSNKRKQPIEAKATCDADQMNSSALKKIISSFKPIEPNHTVQTAKPVKLEDNANFNDADIQFDQELCNIDAEHEPKETPLTGKQSEQKLKQERNFGTELAGW